MKYYCIGTVFSVLSLVPAVSAASPLSQGTSYGGVQVAQFTYKDDRYSDSSNPEALIGRLGAFVTDNISLEARFGVGLSGDGVTNNAPEVAGDVDFEVGQIVGLYALGHYPVGNSASVYGLFGITDAVFNESNDSHSDSMSEDGFSYGLGVAYYPTNSYALTIEYMQYLDESNHDLSAMSLGLKFGF